MPDGERLERLHDEYVWEVNAAIGEGREDLAWRLADEYFHRAVRMLLTDEPPGCGRPDCGICDRPAVSPPTATRRGWWARVVRRHPR